MRTGLILDLDGVIIDSEPLHLQAFREVLRGHGVALSDEAYYGGYIALSDREVFEALLPAGAVVPALAEKERRYLALAAEGLRPYPDALALLRRADSWRLALVTMSLRREAEVALTGLGVRDRFAVLVAWEDCRRGKPDPEPYRLAAEGLGLLPAACVAVEDTPGGVRSAQGAGMFCVAVTNTQPRPLLAGADLVVGSLDEVDLAGLRGG